MSDDKLEQVLGMIFEVEELDDREDSAMVSSRDSECLAMSRLEEISGPAAEAAGFEKEHLLRCARCRHRYEGFRPQEVTSLAVSSPRIPGFLVVLSLLGAAAAILLAVWIGPPAGTSPTLEPTAPKMARYVEEDVEPAADRFQLIAEEGCAVVALLRTWSSDCECLSWKIHEWRDERGERTRHSTLGAGELLSIDVDTGEEPPVSQYLVVVLARRAEDLPIDTLLAAEELLTCLEGVVPEKTSGDYLIELPACLPSGIELLAKKF